MDSSESTATLLLVISELLKEGQIDKAERDKLKSLNLCFIPDLLVSNHYVMESLAKKCKIITEDNIKFHLLIIAKSGTFFHLRLENVDTLQLNFSTDNGNFEEESSPLGAALLKKKMKKAGKQEPGGKRFSLM